MRKEENYGVTYYFGNHPMTCCDMDINPCITTAKIGYNINMPNTDKVFPDVEELVIARSVRDISVPNSMLPQRRVPDASRSCRQLKWCPQKVLPRIFSFSKCEVQFF